jgi:hypothetical protein
MSALAYHPSPVSIDSTGVSFSLGVEILRLALYKDSTQNLGTSLGGGAGLDGQIWASHQTNSE